MKRVQVNNVYNVQNCRLIVDYLVQNYMIRGTLCDVTLTTVDTSIPCHRLLLAANSDYFAAMFTGRYSGQYQDHWCIFRWNVGAESGNCGNTGCGWCSSETTGGILLLR